MATTVAMLIQAPWGTWVGLSGILGLISLSVLAKECARRRTYRSVLAAAGEGTVLIDETPRRRLVVIGPVGAPRLTLTIMRCGEHR